MASQITSRCQTREATTNNQHTTPWPTNKLYQIDDKNTDRVHEIAKRNQITVKTTGSLFKAEFALSCNRDWITFAEKEFLSSYELQDVTSNNSAGRNMLQPWGMTKTALPVLQFQSRWGFNCEGGMITIIVTWMLEPWAQVEKANFGETKIADLEQQAKKMVRNSCPIFFRLLLQIRDLCLSKVRLFHLCPGFQHPCYHPVEARRCWLSVGKTTITSGCLLLQVLVDVL